jgi:hypothetical protein
MGDSNLQSIQLNVTSPRYRPWRELAILGLMVMELAWVVPWFRSLTPATYATTALRAFFVLLVMMGFAHILVRFLNYVRLKVAIRQGLVVGLLIISVFVGLKLLLYKQEDVPLVELANRPLDSFSDWSNLIPDEFVVIVAVLIAWWRGITLAQEHIGPQLVLNHFRLGIIMFVVFVFINTLVTGETPGPMIYVFLFAGLLSMSAARVSVLSTVRGGKQGTFDRRWLLGMVTATVTVVGTATLLSEFAGNQSSSMGVIFLSIFGLFALLSLAILSPLLAIIIWILERIPDTSGNFEVLGEQLDQLRLFMQEFTEKISTFLTETGIPQVLDRWAPNIKSILLWSAIIALIIGVALGVAIRLWRSRSRRRINEEQQSLLEPGDLWMILKNNLRRNLEKLINNVRDPYFFGRRRRIRAALRIRQIYADLMELSSEMGNPRPTAITPHEYLPTLIELFPSNQNEVDLITQSYVRVRYGQYPESQREINNVENAWRLVQDNKSDS